MDPEATIIAHLREGYGVEDIEVLTLGRISADRVRRAIQQMRRLGCLSAIYGNSHTTP